MLGCRSAEVANALTTELGVSSFPEASWMVDSNSGNCVGNCAGIGVGSASGMGAGGLICFGCKPMARIGADRFQS